MGGHINDASRTSGEKRRRNRAIAAAVGLLACSAVVWQSSHATFSSQTSNPNNTLGAGTVTISDDDGGTAVFSADSNLAPGATRTACMTVGYTGSLTPTAIEMYLPNGPTYAQEYESGGAPTAWAFAAGPEMDDNTTLQVQVNDTDLAADPGFNTCPVATYSDVIPATNLRTLINTKNTYATGFTAPTIASGKFRVFKLIYTFSAAAGNSVQGDGVTFSVVWEAQK